MLAPGGGRALVPTGIAIATPRGLRRLRAAAQRSGLKHGVTCLNTPGLIDCGYRDELKVLLINTDPTTPYKVDRGDRIAQLVIQRVEHASFNEVDELPSSESRHRRVRSLGSVVGARAARGRVAASVPHRQGRRSRDLPRSRSPPSPRSRRSTRRSTH